MEGDVDMKSVNQMTAAEIKAAKESGVTVYGARLYRISRQTRKPIYSDVEDFSLKSLRTTIRGMLGRGYTLDEEWAIPEPPDDGSGDFDEEETRQRVIQGTRGMELVEGKPLLPPTNSVLCKESESFAVFVYESDGLHLVSTHPSAVKAAAASDECNRNDPANRYDWAHTTIEHYYHAAPNTFAGLVEASKQALAWIEADECTHGRKFGVGNVLRRAIDQVEGRIDGSYGQAEVVADDVMRTIEDATE